jgi:hypothetical protein
MSHPRRRRIPRRNQQHRPAWNGIPVPECLAGIRSVKDLEDRAGTQDGKHAVLRFADEINRKHREMVLGGEPVVLYHGTPAVFDRFELTRGKRGIGFLGLTNDVDNLGVFLSDSRDLARSYGQDRADGERFRVLEVHTDPGRVLDLATRRMPAALHRTALGVWNRHHHQPQTSLHGNDGVWWLLDQPEFVQAVKAAGYDSVRFREARDMTRGCRPPCRTWMVFDPRRLLISPDQDRVRTVRDLLDVLREAGA